MAAATWIWDRPPVFRIGDVRVVVSSHKAQLADQSMYRYVGIEPTDRRSWSTEFGAFPRRLEPIAEKLLICAAPGAMPADTASLPWTAPSRHPHQAERPCLHASSQTSFNSSATG